MASQYTFGSLNRELFGKENCFLAEDWFKGELHIAADYTHEKSLEGLDMVIEIEFHFIFNKIILI